MSTGVIVDPNIEYPDDDGLPMSDNSLQSDWIVSIHTHLAAMFAEDPNVVVALNMLWYPVEGQPTIRLAPDVFVVFGRPKQYRGSYMQWTEDDKPLSVIFEVLSPGNSVEEMVGKKAFYERYGAEEYYVYDPFSHELDGFIRKDDRFVALPDMNGWISPLLGIRFDLSKGELTIFDPDNEPFDVSSVAVVGKKRAEKELQASNRRERAAKRRADEQKQLADAEKQRADRLAEKLRQLGIDPDA
jgi:Uma2 family endonuclease